MKTSSRCINCYYRLSSCFQLSANVMRTKGGRRLAFIVVVGLAIYAVICFYLLQNVIVAPRRCVQGDGQLNAGDMDDVTDDASLQNVEIDKAWVKKRKRLAHEALAAADTIDDKVTSTARVLIVGYMRGGTTLFGEIFNRKYDHLLWYEPLDSFYMAHYGFDVYSNPLSLLYNLQQSQEQQPQQQQQQQPLQQFANFSRRLAPALELSKLSDFLHALLTCDLGGVPVETLSHPHLYQSSFFRSVYQCMERFDAITRMIDCKRRTRVAEHCAGSTDPNRRRVDVAKRRRCAETIAWLRAERPSALNGTVEARLRADIPDVDILDAPPSSPTVDYRNRTSTTVTTPATTAKLPSESFFDHFRCIDDLEAAVGQSCVEPAASMCSSARLIAVEAVRVAMAELEAVIARLPDIHIIHYVRDPRAIAVSRAVNTRMTFAAPVVEPPHIVPSLPMADDSVVAESQVLCARMLADLQARRRLEARYPGAITVVRYEDLVANPNRTVEAVFKRVAAPGDDVPIDAVNRWLRSAMYSAVETDAFGVHRTDARATASRWASQVSFKQAKEINRNCRRVLLQLGYEL